MAIVDQINRITGQEVGGSIEDALAKWKEQKSSEEKDAVEEVIPEITVTIESDVATVTCDTEVADLVEGIEDGTIKKALVQIGSDTLITTKMLQHKIALNDGEPVNHEVVISFAGYDDQDSMNTCYIIGTRDLDQNADSWNAVI